MSSKKNLEYTIKNQLQKLRKVNSNEVMKEQEKKRNIMHTGHKFLIIHTRY